MGIFKKSVYGLYFALAFVALILFMDSVFPGTLAQTAFTFPALVALFSLLIFEAMFSLH